MQRDIITSRLYTASCFDHSNNHTDDDSMGAENMAQPLIMSNASLKDEEQTMLSKERRSRSILYESFMFATSIAFALRGILFAAFYTIFKMLGEDLPKPTPGSFPSLFLYCMLFLISQLDLVFYVALWLTFVYTNTKSGSLYMRKRFHKDAAANSISSGSTIWTERIMMFISFSFFFGAIAGEVSFLMILMALRTGMIPSLVVSLFGRTVMPAFVLLLIITVKCLSDWRHDRGYTTGQKLKDDSCFLLPV